jgi:membrane protease YdiL (CAAX protease family)
VGLYVLILVPLNCATIAWHLLLREAGADLHEQDVVSLFRDAAREGDVASFAAMAAMAAIVAPVCEEIFFRGFFFGASREKRGAVLAAVASSLAFAVVHFSLSAAAPIFLLGLVLCAIYQRTGSLYAGIFLHSLFNGVSLVLTTYDVVRSAA